MDEDELKRLDVWARKRGWTKSHAVRAAVHALVRSEEEDPLLASSGMIDGLPEDCSDKFDRYLLVAAEITFPGAESRLSADQGSACISLFTRTTTWRF